MKIIIVTGGVLSGLGKGVAAASIGHLLSSTYSVVPIKCDGYLNVDPGTMNPYEHGEVFVLDDGSEVDMDFGHYERFLGINCTGKCSLTMGKLFKSISDQERKGVFLGKTVQWVPHVTNHIANKMKQIANSADITLIEIGGTVGDMEVEVFLEAARELRREFGRENTLFVHLTYVPKPKWLGEHKTKPTQQSVQLLLQRGITPDVIITRSEEAVSDNILKKIAFYCNTEKVISGHDLKEVYEIPLNFHNQGLLTYINKRLRLNAVYDNRWDNYLNSLNTLKDEIIIGIAGKYTSLEDSYASINEALKHCAVHTNTRIRLEWIDTSDPKIMRSKLSLVDALIVPGGFGSRGVEGKISAIKHCREQKIPFLGICYGMQLAVVEFARSVCGLKGANTQEVDPDALHPVIAILPEQKDIDDKGGTMRLGAYSTRLIPGVVYDAYRTQVVSERHRHRFEVNPDYHKILLDAGMIFSGVKGELVEFIELKDHPYFVGTQAHPELKSRPEKPAPLFLSLVRVAKKIKYGEKKVKASAYV